jgi:nucleoside-diphosphate-sugar epimerase
VAEGHRENLAFPAPAGALEVVEGDVRDGTGVAAAVHGVDGVFHQAHGAAGEGDIRHAEADVSAIRRALGWRPEVSVRDGLAALIAGARGAPSQGSPA